MAGGQRGAVAQKADKYALQLFWFPFQRVLSRLLSSRMDTLRARAATWIAVFGAAMDRSVGTPEVLHL
jgi:hypothetical protein